MPLPAKVPHPSLILNRTVWTDAPHGAAVDEKTRKVLYVHITESPGRELISGRRECAALRAIWSYHTEARGWDDIAYSYLLCQPWEREGPATLYVGRGRHRIPASQQGANAGNWSVAVVALANEHIMTRTIAAIAWLARDLGAREIQPHSHQNNTDCPGDQLRARIWQIREWAA